MFGKSTYRFSLAALAVLLAAACGKIETWVGDPVPVTFSTYAQRSTKADASFVAPGADFATGAVIGLYGYYHDASDWATENAAGTNIADFMYHTALTKQSDGTWTYSPIKYWPNNYGTGANSTEVDKLSFWGYYPRNASGLNLYKSGTTTAYDNNSNGIPKVAFTVNSDPAQQVDLMFSQLESDLTKPGISSAVTLHFRHALSLVELNVTAVNGTNATIEITNLTLTNIDTQGTCATPSASIADDQHPENYWSNVGASTTIEVATATTSTSLILMPQTLDADTSAGNSGHSDVHLHMEYDIVFPAAHDPSQSLSYKDNVVDAYLWRDASFTINGVAGTGEAYGVKSWLPGRKYVYNIEAGLERIEFREVTEASWTTEWSPTP